MNAAIQVHHLSYRYAEGMDALRNVSFTITPGECVGLIGPNGAGKSTLLLHLNGLLPHDHDAGSHDHSHGHIDPHHEHGPAHSHLHDASFHAVTVDGIPVKNDTLYEVRRKAGLLFQDPNDQLFCPTVFEDVAFGPRQFGLKESEVRQRVTESLLQAGIAGYEDRAPHHLSVGEKRRVCLAGVLACNPSILILDEPTTSLDPKGRRDLKNLLRSISITKLIATHDLDLVVELCPRVIVLDRGTVVADGNTLEILSNEEFMLQHHLECPHALRHMHPH